MPLNGDEPRETASVAAEVIAELEGGSGETETVRESTDTSEKQTETKVEKPASEAKPEKKAEEKKVETKTDEDDDDFDKVPAEIDDPNPRNKGKKVENRIPHSRVKRMVERAKKAIREAADNEWKSKHEPLEQNLNAVLSDIRRLDELMASDPDAFLSEVAKAHPAYKEYRRQVVQEARQAEKPGPDVKDAEGNLTGYSIPQAEKLIQYYADQAKAAAIEEADKKYGPAAKAVEGAQKTAAERAKQAEEDAAYEADATAQQENARKSWPGYKENEAEIEAAFMANKSYRLYDAYIAVVIPKLQKQAMDARAAVLEELKTTPLDTAAGGGGTTEREDTTSKAMSTEEIARDEMRKAGLL